MTKSEVQLTEENEDLWCSICKEWFVKAVTLTCSHSFCKYCIDYWRRSKNNCPICRTTIHSASPTSVIDNLVLKIMDKCTDEAKKRRIKMIEERSVEAAEYESNYEYTLLLIIIDLDASSYDKAEESSSSSSDAEWLSETGESDENHEEEDVVISITIDDDSEPLNGDYGC